MTSIALGVGDAGGKHLATHTLTHSLSPSHKHLPKPSCNLSLSPYNSLCFGICYMSVTRIWVLSCYVVSVDVCLHFGKKKEKKKKTLSRAPLMSRALGKCPVALMVNPALDASMTRTRHRHASSRLLALALGPDHHFLSRLLVRGRPTQDLLLTWSFNIFAKMASVSRSIGRTRTTKHTFNVLQLIRLYLMH